jgi:hypothetical protein
MSDQIEPNAPKPSAPPATGLLPGVACIALYMLLMAMLNAFAAMRGTYGQGRLRIGALLLCTLLIVGIFGLLRLKRWGWAIVTAGTLVMSVGDMYFYTHVHVIFFLIRAAFGMLFFLYLSRPEVRARLR